METIVRKHIARILKYMMMQLLGRGGVMLFFSVCCYFFKDGCLNDIFSLEVF